MRRDLTPENRDEWAQPSGEEVADGEAGGRAAAPSDFGADTVPLRGAERRVEAAEQDARMRIVLGRRWR